MNLSREQLQPIMDQSFHLSQEIHALMDISDHDSTWEELHNLAQLASVIFQTAYRNWLAAPRPVTTPSGTDLLTSVEFETEDAR